MYDETKGAKSSMGNGAMPSASPGGSAPSERKAARGGRPARDPISAGLRQLWADVENEPVPDEFLTLLDNVDAARLQKPPGPDA